MPTPACARVVFLDRDTIPPQIRLQPLSFAHTFESHARTTPEEVAARIADADIVILNKVPLTRASIEAAPKLRVVGVAATGTDNIDLQACLERGIVVTNVRNYAGNTVPEHTFALMLALRRSLVAYRDSVKAGRWQESGQFCYFDYPIRDLANSTLGIIGDGVLGRAVAQVAQGFGMRVLFAAHKGSTGMGPLYTPFEDVLRESDVITLHLPLLPSTRHILAAPEFAQMAQRPLLINTARGGLVDEAALAQALRGGQIAGAGFDVTESEPPAADSPLMQLLDLPNFILTPHVAWASEEAIQGLADQLMGNIEKAWAQPR